MIIKNNNHYYRRIQIELNIKINLYQNKIIQHYYLIYA